MVFQYESKNISLIASKESREGVIELKKDDPEVVDAMIFYIYHFDYIYSQKDQDSCPRIVFDVYMHTIADKYDIAGLMKVAADKFSARTKAGWKTSAFAEAINEVYTGAADPDRELRNAIMDVSSKHAKELSEQDYGAAFRDSTAQLPAFGNDLFAKLASGTSRPVEIEDEKFYQCDSCARVFAMTKVQHSDNSFYGSRTYSCPYCNGSYTSEDWEQHEVNGP